MDKPVEASQLGSSAAHRPASALRAYRLSEGLTLAEVAARTGMSTSTISKLETEKMALTFDKLTHIASSLGIDIAQLLNPPSVQFQAGQSRRSITRRGEGFKVTSDNYEYHHLASDMLNKRFAPIDGLVTARSIEEWGEMVSHPGEEFVYVLEGAIEVHTAVYAPILLQAGDSLYFDSDMPHAYVAAAPGDCRMLSICSPNGRSDA